MDALYLREHGELVAHAAARPEILSRDLDFTFTLLLQLTQLLNASWRGSLTDEVAVNRDGAGSIARLASSIMGPLYQEVKPLDPRKKDANVLTLHRHAPIAHLQNQVGNQRSELAYISDVAIEGHLRGVGPYTHNHANNAPQAAVLLYLAGLCDATIKFSTPCSHPSSLAYTKYIRVCECWRTLGAHGSTEFEALKTIGETDTNIVFESRRGGAEMCFTLPLHDVVDANSAKWVEPSGSSRSGKKEFLRRGLRRRQQVINACICGMLVSTDESVGIPVAQARRVAKEAAEAARDPKEAPAGPGACSGDDSHLESYGEDLPDSASNGSRPSAVTVEVRRAKQHSVLPAVRQAVPPLWLLDKVLATPAAHATVRTLSPGEIEVPAPDVVDTVIRKHIVNLRCFLMRT
ncbi:hypothetical protein I4F81_002841 [Pyropia yezoensis]|uniref:Uncharacterized protein n=1 Tax=Pyropia yezoensis TaxID=2788 RepID=A0ACC3BQT2_PYRYE|nr:hypothetical protein I4F81_002841 [Neopyropia yezoensis]